MPLIGSALGAAMKSAVDGVADKSDRDAVFEAMGTAIVNYFKANAVVTVSVIGVTTGPATLPAAGTPPVGGLT